MVKATVVGDITVDTKKITSGFKSPITSCFRTIAITRTGPPPPFTHTPPFITTKQYKHCPDSSRNHFFFFTNKMFNLHPFLGPLFFPHSLSPSDPPQCLSYT